jgi:hypothetical protein
VGCSQAQRGERSSLCNDLQRKAYRLGGAFRRRRPERQRRQAQGLAGSLRRRTALLSISTGKKWF